MRQYNKIKIKVKNSGIVRLKFFDDSPDGNLVIAESKKNIPFNIKRVYWITNLANHKAVRGKHAHKKLVQYIFCVSGKFTLELDDGLNKQKIVLGNSYFGIKLGPMLWHTMTNFSKDCVILVLANDYYKEKDYIRNYDEFLNYIRRKK